MVQLIKMNTTMKKVTKYIALLIGGIALLSMAACSDDDGRTPSPAVDPNCIGASFVGDNIGYEELEDTDPKEQIGRASCRERV